MNKYEIMFIVRPDLEAAEIWKKQGIAEENIYFFGKDDNWWIAGDSRTLWTRYRNIL